MKKVLMIALKVLLGIIVVALTALGLITLFVGSVLAPIPLTDAFDREKFIVMDENTRKLYEQIRAKSVNEEWKYSATCDDEYSAALPAQNYFCTTKISTEFMTADSADLIRMHDKYFPVISSSKYVTANGNLTKLPLIYFGKRFVVSYAYQQFRTNNDPESSCQYYMYLNQSETSATLLDQGVGMPIITPTTKLTIEFSCRGEASGNWYGNESKSSDF